MCGIAGQIAVSASARVNLDLVPRTAALLAHRGPDDWGYVVDASHQVLLLNTRLAIVDLPGGRQPIANEDHQIWVTLNGECYGFERQRQWLESRGHRFRTRTDTEILVHLYEEFGESFVDRLRGEYAFALHDRRRGICLLVRDRFGIKPLVFTEHGGRVLFASEAKALFADPLVDRALDHEQIFHILGGVFLPERTVFRGIQQVEPGTAMRVDVGRGWTRTRYWQLPFERSGSLANTSSRDDDTIAAFADKLRESTRIRLHGDAPVGAYLSGGVDSTAIVQAMRETGRDVRTFTIGFNTDRYDESAEAAAVAGALGAANELLRVERGDLAAPFVDSMWHGEAPVVNAHGAAKFLLSRQAAPRVKVVLTGEGADELLAGYPQFRHQELLDRCRRSPHDQEAARQLAAFAAGTTAFSGTVPIRRYPSYERVTERFGVYPYPLTRVFAYQRPIRWLTSPDFRRMATGLDTLAALDAALGPQAFAGLDPVSASQYFLFRTELPGYILSSLGDRQEMAHGIEGRLPFLDHELVELACRLPRHLTLNPRRNKHILRCVVEPVLPAAANREKRVFVAPSIEALGLDRANTPLGAWLGSAAVRDTGVFSPVALTAIRRAAPYLPRGGRPHTVAEAVLVFALSLQVLDGLFCRDFAGASARYAPDPARFDIVTGNVGTRAPASGANAGPA